MNRMKQWEKQHGMTCEIHSDNHYGRLFERLWCECMDLAARERRSATPSKGIHATLIECARMYRDPEKRRIPLKTCYEYRFAIPDGLYQ